MSAAIVTADNSCCNPCDAPVVQQIPGPQGDPGADGHDGIDGQNAYTALTSGFAMPAELASASAAVDSSTWMSIGQVVFVQGLGYLQVTAKADPTHATLKNLEDTPNGAYVVNAVPGTVAGAGSVVAAAGVQGPAGALTGAAGGDLKATYPSPKIALANTLGALIVGNGTDAKTLAGGTDDQTAIATPSTTVLGVAWKKKFVSAADAAVADNRIPRLDTAAADQLPVPFQSSKVTITDNGAIQADGSGGNARGADAVDLQVSRGVVTQVASGARSVVGGGDNNTASGTESAALGGDSNVASGARGAVAGGQGNTASGQESFVGSGQLNVASNTQSAVAGGDQNVASGDESFVGGGHVNVASAVDAAVVGGINNTASGQYSAVGGGASNVAAGIYSGIPGGYGGKTGLHGQIAHGAGFFALGGDAQAFTVISRIATTDATANVEAFLDGASLTIAVPTNSACNFQMQIVGVTATGAAASYFTVVGGVRNTGGATTIAGVTVSTLNDGIGVAGVPSVDASAAYLRVRVTGKAATPIRWVITTRICEVNFP